MRGRMQNAVRAVEAETVYFTEPGEHNTEQALSLSKRRVEELDIKAIIIFSTTGSAAVKAVDYFKRL